MNYGYILFESSGLSRYTDKGNIITVYRGIKINTIKTLREKKQDIATVIHFGVL